MDTLAQLEHDYPTFIYKTAQQYGLSKDKIHELSIEGTIEKIDRGIYIFPGYLLDEFSLISQKFSRGVFSLVSALIIHNLTDEMPLHYDLTFPKGYHPSAASLKKYHIKARYLSKKALFIRYQNRPNRKWWHGSSLFYRTNLIRYLEIKTNSTLHQK
ncbi:type IV toxin-antitoxin system AbiEi family antitoxin domain-containing protein [Pediococcus inopinatus]|uniref:type IV toxin-antitoxin system AbiEi family antitoxin domain-containing protein n=1 Tax=Pediococcus inopinatus TaxID=114090 RepID=UPI000712969E|nr:hypothetical protein [Pediococcus inopinatus]KRN63736.1 hypothetical protein IV83_GL000030 [Pediococcus inopinatus]